MIFAFYCTNLTGKELYFLSTEAFRILIPYRVYMQITLTNNGHLGYTDTSNRQLTKRIFFVQIQQGMTALAKVVYLQPCVNKPTCGEQFCSEQYCWVLKCPPASDKAKLLLPKQLVAGSLIVAALLLAGGCFKTQQYCQLRRLTTAFLFVLDTSVSLKRGIVIEGVQKSLPER